MARHAPHYDRTRWAFLHGRSALARRMPLPPRGRVLDIGCGSGAWIAALLRAHPEARAVGLDVSPEMLARARRRLGDRATWIEGDAPAAMPEGPFDAIACSYALTMASDPDAILRAAAQALAPGGVLGVVDFLEPIGALGRRWFARYPLRLDPALPRAVERAVGGPCELRVRRSPWGLWRWFETIVTSTGKENR